MHSTSFGIARALIRLQDRLLDDSMAPFHGSADSSTSNANAAGAAGGNGGAMSSAVRIARIQRQKVRIDRDPSHFFEYVIRTMELFASTKALLEVEFSGEVGTGLGPTLEFYAMGSREFRRVERGMWRHSSAALDKEGTSCSIAGLCI